MHPDTATPATHCPGIDASRWPLPIGQRIRESASTGTIVDHVDETEPVLPFGRPRGACYLVRWDGPSPERPGATTLIAAPIAEAILL